MKRVILVLIMIFSYNGLYAGGYNPFSSDDEYEYDKNAVNGKVHQNNYSTSSNYSNHNYNSSSSSKKYSERKVVYKNYSRRTVGGYSGSSSYGGSGYSGSYGGVGGGQGISNRSNNKMKKGRKPVRKVTINYVKPIPSGNTIRPNFSLLGKLGGR